MNLPYKLPGRTSIWSRTIKHISWTWENGGQGLLQEWSIQDLRRGWQLLKGPSTSLYVGPGRCSLVRSALTSQARKLLSTARDLVNLVTFQVAQPCCFSGRVSECKLCLNWSLSHLTQKPSLNNLGIRSCLSQEFKYNFSGKSCNCTVQSCNMY